MGLALNGDLSSTKEYSYVHLQKRVLDCSYIPTGAFMIVPDQFEECRTISENDILRFTSKDSKYEKVKSERV